MAAKAESTTLACYTQLRRLRAHGDDEVVGGHDDGNNYAVYKYTSNYSCHCEVYATSCHPAIPQAPSQYPPQHFLLRRMHTAALHCPQLQHNDMSTINNIYNLQTLLHALGKPTGIMKRLLLFGTKN